MSLDYKLRPASLDGLAVATRDFLVADHAMEIAQGTEVCSTNGVEFGMISQQQALPGLAHDLLLDLHLVKIEAGDAAVQADPGRRDKGPGQAHAIEDAGFGVALEHLVLAVEYTAAQDDAAVGFLLQLEQHVERVAHRGELKLIGDEVDHERDRRATVEKNRVAGTDESGGQLADAALLLDMAGVLLADPVIPRFRIIVGTGDVAAQQT